MARFYIVLIVVCLSSSNILYAQDTLLYETSFDDSKSLQQLEFSDPQAWRISEGALELFGKSDYESRVRSPFNIALITIQKYGSLTMELDMKQTGREYGHRDMCLIFSAKDPTNFYYVHIASAADQNAHNIFIVNDEARRPIGTKTTSGIDWGEEWHKIKLVHNVESGLIQVYFDDMDNPIMEATDNHFDGGYVGFGSFDDTGMIDNVRIRGLVKRSPKGFFE